MANRRMFQFRYSLERDIVELFAKVAIGGTGAPTLSLGKGIASISRVSAGIYDITLQDNFNVFLGCDVNFIASSGSPAAPDVSVTSEAVSTTKVIRIQCNDADTPAATDPGSGETMLMRITLRNSST